MKRLFATIFTVIALCAAYSETNVLQPVKYCNVGPLAAVNACMYCIQVVKENAQNLRVLEAHAGVVERQEQLDAVLQSYNKTPQKLQIMKNKICRIKGLNPAKVQIKLDKTKNYVSTNTMIGVITVDKGFLKKPYDHQWGVLSHEIGHIIHNDCEEQLKFDLASAYTTALSAYVITYSLHIPHTEELHQPVTQAVQAAYSRLQEKRADSEAAQVPGAAKGLLEYLEASEQHDTDEFDMFDTHPPYQERIEDLKPFVQHEK